MAPGKRTSPAARMPSKSRGGVTAVVAGELGGRRHPHLVAEARPRHQRPLVDAPDLRGAVGVPVRPNVFHVRTEAERDAERAAAFGQLMGEPLRVAGRVAGVVNGTGERGGAVLERGLEVGHLVSPENRLLLAVLTHQSRLLGRVLELPGRPVEVEDAAVGLPVLDALARDELGHRLLAVLGECELGQGVASRPRRGALAQEPETQRARSTSSRA